MLEKLENAYLAILRTVVIAASGLLLVAVVILGLSALKGFRSEPKENLTSPRIETKVIIGKITNPAGGSVYSSRSSSGSPQDSSDPNMQSYTLIAKAILKFVNEASSGRDHIDEKMTIKFIKGRTELIKPVDLQADYAKGLALVIDSVLSANEIRNLTQTKSTYEVIDLLLNEYTGEFNTQVELKQKALAEEQAKYVETKQSATQSLYAAIGGFGIFLLIVFLSIFIKIERSLRNLDKTSLRS